MTPRLAAVVAAVALAGPTPSPPPAVALGAFFRLAPGQSAHFEVGALRVRFDRVTEDSRCPTSVTCIWEGDATVVLVAREGGGPERRHELHTREGGSAATHGPYRIRLVRLTPEPATPGPVPAADYRVVLVVTRVDAAPKGGV